MRILQINTEKGWRGGERQTLYNIRGFLEQGHHVALVCRQGEPLSEKCRGLPCEQFTVNTDFHAFLKIAQIGRNYDILHAQTSGSQLAAVLASLWNSKPVVYSRRVDFVPKGFLTKLKYDRTKRVVAISEAIRKIMTQFGVRETEVISDIAFPFVPNRQRAEKLAEASISEGKRIIGTMAALVPHKDPLNMVRAISELAQRRDDFVFLHFGEGVMREEMVREIEKCNIGHCYKLMGFIPDAEDLFSILEVFAMSSREEGLGSSVLDAFLQRVPVASTSAGGLKELVEGRGLLCDVEDSLGLALCIHEILGNSQLAEDLKVLGFKAASENYSIREITNKYLKVFEEVKSQ